MKILIKILILVLFFYVSDSPPAQGQTVNTPGAAASPQDTSPQDTEPGETPDLKEYENENTGTQEDDIFSYEEDFLTRKLFQRDLPRLTQKERITWSFRMADTNAFL